MAIAYPPAFINAYLQEKVTEYFRNNPLDGFSGDYTIPLFPTLPTDIDSLTETFPESEGKFAVYDRMFKMRRGPFPHIKSEQLLYYFYATGSSPSVFLIETAQKIQDLLDRGDESAEEVNVWLQNKQKSATPLQDDLGNKINPVFFHNIKVFQLEESRDIIDFGTARTYAGNKIIIDYDYHLQESNWNS